jgi:glycosyltransferase involved in cell wall biosynthesis
MTEIARQHSSAEKLRIAYLFQQFPVLTETFAVSDIAALIAQGHQVSVYTIKFTPRRERLLRETLGVPCEWSIHRPSLAGALSWPRILWRWRGEAAWLFRRIVRQWKSAPITCIQALLCIPRLVEIAGHVADHQYDVVHAFWSRHVGLVLPLLKQRGATALRTSFVGAYDLVANDFILDLTAQAADVLFSHAEANRCFLEHKAHSAASIAIIHRGIPLMPRGAPDARDPFRLVTASALVQSKNVERIVRSFAEVHAEEDRLRLEIYGDGPERPRLERIARELGCSTAVEFKGHVSRDALFERMQAASIFLLLSKKPSERLPNVLKEALWAGCAVISSNSEGIEELIPDASVGIVVNPDDQQAITEKVRKLLRESAAESEARRQRAGAFIAANYSSEASMRRYVDAWRSKTLAAAHGRSSSKGSVRPTANGDGAESSASSRHGRDNDDRHIRPRPGM